ncbi:MAG TPA: murein L,D-transpeptidase, partial [Paracoccaceae bacterium]
MPRPLARATFSRSLFLVVSVVVTLGIAASAQAQNRVLLTPFTQALAEAAASDDDIAAFYRSRDYQTLWTGTADEARRNALLTALSRAGDHGLPVQRYDAAALTAGFHAARTEGDRGRLEVRMTRAFLDYARDIQTGVLVPAKVDGGIVREVPVRGRLANLRAFMAVEPAEFLNNLPPKNPAYAMLMKAKLRLEAQIAAENRGGGW